MSHNEFKEKLKSIQWGIVPGASRATTSRSYFDRDSLPDFPSKEEALDYQSDFRNAPVKEMRVNASSGRLEEK